MDNYKLSVIVTNYNYGRYLSQCLDSIISQTYKPFEIIIADDASTDNSVEVIKKYEEKYPQVKGIINKKNQKLARNKHNAILSAKGNYITFIDSDDFYVSKYKLEKEMELVKKFKEEAGKDTIAFSKHIYVDKEGKKCSDVIIKRMVQGNIYYNLLSFSFRNYKPRDFTLCKQAYLSVDGFDYKSKLYVDDCLKLKLAAKYEFYFCGELGTAYRKHGLGMSSKSKFTHYEWQKYSFRKSLVYLDKQKKIFAYFIFYFNLIRRMIRHSIIFILKKNDKAYKFFIRLYRNYI